ncbi:hypothetical protein BKA56DRAFT_728128 [Ilyonectria sp. MPI-CAGE-AT-0026]|nr:hypothetical protein BKA56DRAFT_728128 [Ilyonectria sp. MPI-CAGE-AT-0026]
MDSTMDDTSEPSPKKRQLLGGSLPPKQENKDADSASLSTGDVTSVESVLPAHTSPDASISLEDDSPSQEDDSPQPMQDNEDADATFLIADEGDSMESVLPTHTSPDASQSQEDDSPLQEDDSLQPMQENKDVDSTSLAAGDGDSMESVLSTHTSPDASPSQDDVSLQPKSNEADDSATRELLQPIADSTPPGAFNKSSLAPSAPTQTTSDASDIPDSIPSNAFDAFMDARYVATEGKEHYEARASLEDEEAERWQGGDSHRDLFGKPVYLYQPFENFKYTVDGDVLTFTRECLPLDLSWEDLDTETQNRLKEWAPDAEQYVADLSTTGGLLQLLSAWVWRILFYNLFSADCDDKWAGEAWAAFGKMLRGFQGRIRNADDSFTWTFHTWRYHSVRMLHALHGAHTEPARLDAIFRKELDPLIKIMKMRRNPDYHAGRFGKYLGTMIENAIKLDLRVLSHKARICFEMRDPETLKVTGFPYKYDKNVMECYDEPEDGTIVGLVMRPGLRLYGRVGARMHLLPRDRSHFHIEEPAYADYHRFEAKPMLVAVKPARSGKSYE